MALGTVPVGAAFGFAGIYGIVGLKRNGPGHPPCASSGGPGEEVVPLTHGEVAALTLATKPLRIPDLAFVDGAASRRSSRTGGATVLLNLWATWCVPCRREMPALDTCRPNWGEDKFEVVAVNIDTRNLDRPRVPGGRHSDPSAFSAIQSPGLSGP